MESGAALPEISIQPSPFGQRTPPIPTAQSITVARVASPVTTQRKYQQVLLRALRKYFDGKRCLLKKGDLFAVAVDVSNATIFEDGLDSAEGKAKEECLHEIIDLSVFPTLPDPPVHLDIEPLQNTDSLRTLRTFAL